MSKIDTTLFLETIRRYQRIAAFGVFGVIVGAVSMTITLSFIGIDTGYSIESESTYSIDVPSVKVLEASEPVSLRIPSVGIAADFESPLELHGTQEIEVPKSYDTVARYKYAPTPGELGPAVILGHVDSYRGPAVLFPLKNIQLGATIEIDREDGTTAVFEVIKLESHEQEGFPTEKVYGNIDHAGLRLITCTGWYNHGTQRYSHNLIVFARLIEDPVVEL